MARLRAWTARRGRLVRFMLLLVLSVPVVGIAIVTPAFTGKTALLIVLLGALSIPFGLYD